MTQAKTLILAAGITGAVAIAIGAFGAHGLPAFLKQKNVEATDIAKRIGWLETGAQYHRFHSLALLALAGVALQFPSRWISIAGICFVLGIFVFSGLLYVMSVTGIAKLGAIVPLGGLSYILGWLAVAIASFSIKVTGG